MFLNNKIIFGVIVVHDLCLQKLVKLCGGDSAYPFCEINRGRVCLDRTSNTRVVSLYVSKKVFSCIFQAMSTRCNAAGCSKTTKDRVSLQAHEELVCICSTPFTATRSTREIPFKFTHSGDIFISLRKVILLNLQSRSASYSIYIPLLKQYPFYINKSQ